jgi:hypothetical protein
MKLGYAFLEVCQRDYHCFIAHLLELSGFLLLQSSLPGFSMIFGRGTLHVLSYAGSMAPYC